MSSIKVIQVTKVMEEITIFDIPKEICSTATTCLKNSKKKKKRKKKRS